MIADPSAINLIVRVLFLFGYALLFALAEIEIEGPHGWAERLPTWFRVTTPGARLFGLILSGQRATAHQLLAGFPRSSVAADAELSALRAAYELDRGSPDEA